MQLMSTADIYVRFDDVKFSKGSFTNRVQIKTRQGKTWASLPVGKQDDRSIDGITIANLDVVFGRIRSQIIENYRSARFLSDAVSIFDQVVSAGSTNLSDISYNSTICLLDYFGVLEQLTLLDIRDLQISGSGSDRVLEICRQTGAKNYLSANGGLKYLDHSKFESNGISVQYPIYKLEPWEQSGDQFDPYVSALDVVANCGPKAQDMIEIQYESWRDRIESTT